MRSHSCIRRIRKIPIKFLIERPIALLCASNFSKSVAVRSGLRYALMIVLLAVGIVFSGVFNTITMLASFLFATIAVYMRMIFNKDKKTDAKASDENKATEVVNSEERDVVQ